MENAGTLPDDSAKRTLAAWVSKAVIPTSEQQVLARAEALCRAASEKTIGRVTRARVLNAWRQRRGWVIACLGRTPRIDLLGLPHISREELYYLDALLHEDQTL
ncbi:MAG: hypothetical protein M3O70_17955 [Actinomycetota bacterium]|nr:hypothetical protein [Actinomycetota bacterium]